MNGPRRQLFSGAALTRKQDRRISGATLEINCNTSRTRRAFAHQVVLDIEVGNQPLVFTDQPFDVARVFDGHRGDCGNRRHQLQVVLVKNGVGLSGVEVNHAQRSIEHDDRHAQDRRRAIADQTLGVSSPLVVGWLLISSDSP